MLCYLLDVFVMVGNWGKKGLMIQTGTLLLSFLSLGLTSGKMEIDGDSEPSQTRVEKT